MTARRATTVLLAAAIALLLVALVGAAADLLSDGIVDALAVAGLGLLAIGQGVRAWRDRTPRAILILLLVLALIAFVLLD